MLLDVGCKRSQIEQSSLGSVTILRPRIASLKQGDAKACRKFWLAALCNPDFSLVLSYSVPLEKAFRRFLSKVPRSVAQCTGKLSLLLSVYFMSIFGRLLCGPAWHGG